MKNRKFIAIFSAAIAILLAVGVIVFLKVIFHDTGPEKSRDPVPVLGENCRLKYPLVLSHHWGVEWRPGGDAAADPTPNPELPPRNNPPDSPELRGRDTGGFYRYFSSDIVERLRDRGVTVYIADKTPFTSLEERARQLRGTVLRALQETGAEKVNIVGHSQGCQDSRYMISNLRRFDPGDPGYNGPQDFPMGEKVASWTGLAGEVEGTIISDLALWIFDTSWDMHESNIMESAPPSMQNPGGRNILKEKFRQSLVSLTPGYMKNEFSATDYPGVYYQSYAARIRRPRPEWGGTRPYWFLLKLTGGGNDGYTTVESQSYGELRGVLEGPAGSCGVHHMFFTGRPGKVYAPDGYMSAADFFELLACGLGSRGY